MTATWPFESEMVQVLYQHFLRQGYRAYLEVPCFSRNVDLVVELPEGLAAVECKLTEWRRGLIQARHHLIAFDYSFVCLPNRQITNKMRRAFEEEGVGLLLLTVSEQGFRLQTVMEAPRSSEKVQLVQDSILAILQRWSPGQTAAGGEER